MKSARFEATGSKGGRGGSSGASGEVRSAGVTLPAGCYMFRLAGDTRGRDVVQVLSGDGTTVYAMFAALRTSRGEAADKARVLFRETSSDMPIAVRSWWYPAESYGYEFLYLHKIRTDANSVTRTRHGRH